MINTIRKGARVRTSGLGKTKNWRKMYGRVTRKKGKYVYVIWKGTNFEDEMKLKEVKLIKW